MSCQEMQEWNEVEEQVEELIRLELPGLPLKEEIMEAIHVESHVLIDLQKAVSAKPNLKKVEMAPLLAEATKRVITRLRKRSERPLVHVGLKLKSG